MSPRTQDQNGKIREERIQQIMSAAMKVYLQKGVKGTEMGEIAKEAGIARGLVYYYYKDKMELFRELFSKYINEAKTFIHSSLTADEEVLVKLKNYIHFYLEMAYKHPDFLLFYRNLEKDIPVVFENGSTPVLDNYIQSTHQPLLNLFEQAVKEGKLKNAEPRLLANLYWGSLTGALDYFTKETPSNDQAEEIISKVIDLIFDGILDK